MKEPWAPTCDQAIMVMQTMIHGPDEKEPRIAYRVGRWAVRATTVNGERLDTGRLVNGFVLMHVETGLIAAWGEHFDIVARVADDISRFNSRDVDATTLAELESQVDDVIVEWLRHMRNTGVLIGFTWWADDQEIAAEPAKMQPEDWAELGVLVDSIRMGHSVGQQELRNDHAEHEV